MIILPGAIASAFTMAFVGRNSARLDARFTVPVGSGLFFLSMLMLSRLTYDSGAQDLFWPLVFRGVGLGLIFVPLTGATMAELKPNQLAQGTVSNSPDSSAARSALRSVRRPLAITAQSRALLAEHVWGHPTTMAPVDGITRALITRDERDRRRSSGLMIIDRRFRGRPGAGVLEAVPAEWTCAAGGAAVVAAVPFREVERARAGGTLASVPVGLRPTSTRPRPVSSEY